jgi:hypothetical protein
LPEPGPEIERKRYQGELNDAQRRRLASTCKYIDRLLLDIEHALHPAASQTLFPRYVVDMDAAHIRALEDQIRRFRLQLLRALAWQHMKPEAPESPVTGLLITNLAFVENAIEELKPHYMRGYGAISGDAEDDLNGIIDELRSMAQGMEEYLRRD